MSDTLCIHSKDERGGARCPMCLEQENARLSENNKTLSEENARLRRDLADSEKELDEYEGDISRLRAELEQAEAALADIRNAETRAWWIVCHGKGRVLEHNAIADYRGIDPNSTVSELIERPTK